MFGLGKPHVPRLTAGPWVSIAALDGRRSELSPQLGEKPFLQCRADPKFVDGRLLIRRLDTAKQRGWRPFDVVNIPGELLARGRRWRRLLLGGRPLHYAFSGQCGRASAPRMPHLVQTMRGPNAGTEM
jgi:hypothetical protein